MPEPRENGPSTSSGNGIRSLSPSKGRALVLAGVLVAGALVVYLVGYLIAGDKLPRNATISGVAVGGLPRAAAADKLRSELGPRAAQPVAVSVNDKPDRVLPEAAGLSVDVDRSITRAGGGKSLDPRQIWQVLTGGSATEALAAVDETKLNASIAALAKTHNAKPADARLAYDGVAVKTTKAVQGVVLRQPAAAAAIRRAYLHTTIPIALPVDLSEPEITTAEATLVVETFAAPAVSAPVTVMASSAGRFTVTPAMIASAVTFQPKDGSLAPVLDPAQLRRAADKEVRSVELNRPRNARFRFVDGRPTIVPAVNGTEVSAASLAKAVEPALTKSGKDRSASVELTGAKAAFSTDDAQKLGITTVTGKFTTHFPYAPYRNVNIGRAAELINGTLLKPGDTFSLNRVVGERTKANGFVVGNIISNGKFRLELGGGVSQSATTTYNAMFFAGLKDVQHQPHTLFIDRYPAGREATVAWPNLDLRFTNDTRYGVLVQARLVRATRGSRGSLTVKMWSTKTYDKITSSSLDRSNFTTGRDLVDSSPECQPMSPVQGFDVHYSRLFWSNGAVVRREGFFWRYSPTDRVLCR